MAGITQTILTTYPGKAIWTLFALTLNAIRLPFWLLYFISPALRQHKEWSYRQAVRVRIVKAFLYNAAVVEMKTPLSLKPGAEKGRFATIQPAPSAYYVGVAAKDPQVKPIPVGATWYPSMPQPGKIGYVVLHFHGGAFVIGDGREKDAGFASKTLHEGTDASHVLALQYRLSSNPGCRFPAQLQDAISSYAYLVREMGVPPSQIILSGDSAGGNLVLSLVRYLAEHGAEVGLKNPGAALCWSPWVNPNESVRLGISAIERNPNYPTDYLSGEFGNWGARTLMPDPKTGITLEDPYIKILDNAFATDVPIYIQTGQCEVLLYDNVALAEQFQKVKGNTVQLQIEEDSVHDIILTGKIMSFEKEAKRAVKRANVFLRKYVVDA